VLVYYEGAATIPGKLLEGKENFTYPKKKHLHMTHRGFPQSILMMMMMKQHGCGNKYKKKVCLLKGSMFHELVIRNAIHIGMQRNTIT